MASSLQREKPSTHDYQIKRNPPFKLRKDDKQTFTLRNLSSHICALGKKQMQPPFINMPKILWSGNESRMAPSYLRRKQSDDYSFRFFCS